MRILALGFLAGCGGTGTWTLETWGEDYIEEGMPTSVFADGCEVRFDRFLVVTKDRALLDDAGEVVASLDGAQVYDLVAAGPHEMGSLDVPSGTWRGMTTTIAPDDAATAGNASAADVDLMQARGAAILTQGTLACGEASVTFDWSFATATRYDCDPTNLVIDAGGAATTQFTVHGDHLFYDSLVDPDAEVRGVALVEADVDEDGTVTQAELVASPVAPTGYTVGGNTGVDDLEGYLEVATTSVGHVDGEGHCDVSVL